MKQGNDFVRLTEVFCARNYNPLPVIVSRGKGVWVRDVYGKKYLDMSSCYSALNFGHRHPRIERAFVKQLKRLGVFSRAFHNDQLGPFSKELADLCGQEVAIAPMVLPMNTGVEAVETAIKAARRWGYRVKKVEEGKAEIIVCDNNFHGRTTTVIGFSSYEKYRDGFGPFTPGFVRIPFNDLRSLEAVISPNTVAFLVEPIQGEGGVRIPWHRYLKEVQEICRRNNVLLIIDEVQTGLGRTGLLFAYQHDLVYPPDLLILGKALGGGVYPISAVVGSRNILSLLGPGSHGSTFGGNPLACAVAREAIRVLVDEKLSENAWEAGCYFLQRLRVLESPSIKEVRGRGLIIGLELREGVDTARSFCERLLNEGILANESRESVVRLTPPLIITKKEIDWAVERIKRVLKN